MELLNYITDRNEEDVTRSKYLATQLRNNTITEEERIEWNANLKGSLNYSDLNRVVNSINMIIEYLNYDIDKLVVPDIVYDSFLDEILNDVNYIVENYGKKSESPDVPTTPLNTYIKWDNIELILQGINEHLVASDADIQYCNNNLYADFNILI